MIGFGGILAEAIADVSFRLVPLERVDADEMIDELGPRRSSVRSGASPQSTATRLAATILGLSARSRRPSPTSCRST